jgi:hypothetical protein
MQNDRITAPIHNPTTLERSCGSAGARVTAEQQRQPLKPVLRISQGELAEYYARQKQLAHLKRDQKALRASLINRLKGGAQIDPGRLHAVVRTCRHRPLTQGNLEVILGSDEVERLKGLVPPLDRVQLSVTAK